MKPRALALVLLTLVTCRRPSRTTAQQRPSPAPPPHAAATLDPRFAARVLEVARAYHAWFRVDETAGWAPWDCRAPPYSRAWLSAAPASSVHGLKLYHLFASDLQRYYDAASRPAASDGLSLVKESFVPREVHGATPAPGMTPDVAVRDGRVYVPGEPAGLFVMTRVAPDTPGTDAGWIYGTVDPEGRVTSAGRVATCMRCHDEAPHGRLFGPDERPHPTT